MMSLPSPQMTQPDIFNQIRESCRLVAENAAHVQIRQDRLKAYAISLPSHAPDNALDTDHHYISDNLESLTASIVILEAINFGSGYTDALIDEGWETLDNSIYFTVSTALKRHFDACGPFTADALRALGAEDIARILNLPRDGMMARDIASLYASSANELGAMVAERYKGRFMGLIEDSDGLAARFIQYIGALSGFRDVHSYHGKEIILFKRAQHLAATLNGMFTRIGRPLFRDMDRLTIFADNAIPHVLHTDGILEYTPTLAARINAGEFIASGSEEEIEIRCCAVEAMERISTLKGAGTVAMDYTLWHRSVEDPRYRIGLPHRTKTRFY